MLLIKSLRRAFVGVALVPALVVGAPAIASANSGSRPESRATAHVNDERGPDGGLLSDLINIDLGSSGRDSNRRSDAEDWYRNGGRHHGEENRHPLINVDLGSLGRDSYRRDERTGSNRGNHSDSNRSHDHSGWNHSIHHSGWNHSIHHSGWKRCNHRSEWKRSNHDSDWDGSNHRSGWNHGDDRNEWNRGFERDREGLLSGVVHLVDAIL